MIIALYIGLMRRLPPWRIEKVTRKADIASLAHDRKERRLHFLGYRAASNQLGSWAAK